MGSNSYAQLCCLRLLTHMLWDYRAEDWRTLLTSLLSKALSCAYLTASVREYLDLSLEALAHFPTDWQQRVLDNVLSVIKVSKLNILQFNNKKRVNS